MRYPMPQPPSGFSTIKATRSAAWRSRETCTESMKPSDRALQAIEIGFDVGRLDVVDLFRVNQAEAGNDSAVGIGEVRVHDPGRDEVLDCCRAAGGDPRRPRGEHPHIEDR